MLCYRSQCVVLNESVCCVTGVTVLCYRSQCVLLQESVCCVTVVSVLCYTSECCVTGVNVLCYRSQGVVLQESVCCVTGVSVVCYRSQCVVLQESVCCVTGVSVLCYRSQVPAEAEENFLKKACTLDTYGVDPHPVKVHTPLSTVSLSGQHLFVLLCAVLETLCFLYRYVDCHMFLSLFPSFPLSISSYLLLSSSIPSSFSHFPFSLPPPPYVSPTVHPSLWHLFISILFACSSISTSIC